MRLRGQLSCWWSSVFPQCCVRVAVADDPRATAALARSCYRTGTVEQARLCMERIKDASPQGIFMAATVAADAEDFATAEAMYNSIKSGYPNRAALDYQLALVQYHEGHIADSQSTLTDMIARGEGNGDTHNLLGWCWFKSNDLNQAEQELNEAIRLDPPSETNYLDLARMQLAGRQLDAALESTRRAVKLFPSQQMHGWSRVESRRGATTRRRRDLLRHGSHGLRPKECRRGTRPDERAVASRKDGAGANRLPATAAALSS